MKTNISEKIDRLWMDVHRLLPEKEEKTAVTGMTVGRRFWGQVRNFLKQCQFEGMEIEWMESDGFFVHDFTIKGSEKDIMEIGGRIEEAERKLAEMHSKRR